MPTTLNYPLAIAREHPADDFSCAELSGTETVLICSDTPPLRDAFADALRGFGYSIVMAADSFDVQSCVRARPDIRLLLMDWSEEDPRHLQLALAFRAQYPAVKVLVACESIWDFEQLLGHSDRFTFLLKPFTARVLARMVRRVLD